MNVELITRKIITEMGNEIWTIDHHGYAVVPDSPDEVDQVLDFLSPYFDDIDNSDACLYDGCECGDDDCTIMPMPELPKHEPNIA